MVMDAGKEQTILTLAYDLEKGLNCLEADLDKVLKRGVEEGTKSEAEAQNPSVVGEIIEVLERDGLRLANLSDIIKLQILSKL